MAVYNGIDYLEKCLAPWIEYREKNPNGLAISIVDSKFKDFDGEAVNSTDGTVSLLVNYLNCGKIDYFGCISPNQTEHEARNFALAMLPKDVNYIISWGVDEIITLEQIEYLISYIERNPEIFVFHIYYKNLFNDENHYIDDGFCPRRVWKVEDSRYKLLEFSFDDDIKYVNKSTNQEFQDQQLATIRVPKNKLFVDHFSWCDFDRNVKKINYQEKHFKFGCSYRINFDKKCIEINPDYYKKIGQPQPEVKSCGY
jgi:hypothetical protein